MSGSVVVIGSINIDRVSQVSKLPAPGETAVGTDFELHSGGKGANQAVAAALLGATVKLVGSIGSDKDGDFVLSHLMADGVDTRNITRSADAPTGVAIIVVDETSENLIVVSPGANRFLASPDIDSAIENLDSKDILSIALEGGAGPAFHALSQRLVATTIINLSPITPDAAALIPLTDIVIMNEHELYALANIDAQTGRDQIRNTLTDLGARNVIITRGEAGAWLLTELNTDTSTFQELPAPAVAALDTTGCGDAFIGALATRLAEAAPLNDAAAFALRVASLAATRLGAQTSFPRREELGRVL